MVDQKEFKNFVLSQLPKEIIKYLVEGIAKIYQNSHDDVFGKYEREQAIDLFPQDRRAQIESFLRVIPNRFPELQIGCKLNDASNYYHVEIYINQLVITQSFCRLPNDKIREANFRNSLSEFNIQIGLEFPDYPKNEPQDNAKKYYVILAHGDENRESKCPKFFNLRFPSTNNENIVDPIDILELYNISINSVGIEAIEENTLLNNPPLRKTGKIEEGE